MLNIYVVAPMTGSRDKMEWVRNAILMQDWYSSEMGALATMDQYNADVLEKLPTEIYEKGDFHLYGVFKFEFMGIV